MRKVYVTFALALVMVLTISSLSFAAGIPQAHELSGAAFGAAVAAMARTYPGAVAEHVSGKTEVDETMGMPAAHGLTGAEFGKAVSDTAKSDPGAIAAHVNGK